MSFPKLFIERINAKLGSEAPEFFSAMEQKPAVSIRVNPKKGPGLFASEEPVPWCRYGKYLAERPSFVFDPMYHAGAYYAQEASSMLFANAIDFTEDLKVLDLCAAPGGKSSLLLSMLSPDSLLVSNELVGKRTVILNENLVKWGYPNIIITKNRADEFLPLEGFFDVVLIDAPCSGEGMFRKDEEAIHQWSDGLVQQCSAIQKEILNSAIRLVKPGGLLVYSTCTFEDAENENNLHYLYEEFGEKLDPADVELNPEWGMKEVQVVVKQGIQRGYYCFPHRVKGEGLFVSAINVMENKHFFFPRNLKPQLRKATDSQKAILKPFIKENGGLEIYLLNEQVVLLPSVFEKEADYIISRLNVSKTGITAGTLQRDTFIPDHDLAMSGLVNENIPRVELEQRPALEYLHRQTLAPQENLTKGWFIYTHQNVPLGWAKNLGNRINNHYPQEWRIRKELEKE